jgi:hypothetical protein
MRITRSNDECAENPFTAAETQYGRGRRQASFTASFRPEFSPKSIASLTPCRGCSPNVTSEMSRKYHGIESKNSPCVKKEVTAGENCWNATLIPGSIRREKGMKIDRGEGEMKVGILII